MLAADLEVLTEDEQVVSAGGSDPAAGGDLQGCDNELGGGNLRTWTDYYSLETTDVCTDCLTKTFLGWVLTETIGNSFECRLIRDSFQTNFQICHPF